LTRSRLLQSIRAASRREFAAMRESDARKRSMRRLLPVLWLLLMGSPALADRITEMNPTERCTYIAKLQVAGYYYYSQGRPRAEVKVHWHGDETQYEIEFITATLDAAYTWLTNSGVTESTLSAQAFGDMVYEACMSGRAL
jgi:hypothetical protein